ncbi:putative ABC transport system permease protein [Lachnospiraceae bacterium NLAE-zl-G231]|nr:putative ABC transport system permease protein [Lachnospiraceae bacterium NLAE-zl-G231]
MHNTISVIRQSIQMSLQNIKSNKMRTFLTTLGIIIGVTAVIALITIVDGVIGSVMGQFSSLGAGTLSVSITGSSLKKGLTESDLDSLEQLENVSGISPSVSITTTAARPGKLLDHVSVQGKNDYYFRNNDLVSYGRAITRQDVENEAYVCIIDQDLADNLFPGEDPLGSQVIVGGVRYTVIGLQGEDSNLMASMAGMGGSVDGTITIPYTNALKLSGNSSVTSLDVYVADTDRTQELQEAVESVLYKAFNENEDCYNVFSMDSLLDTMDSMMSMMTYMLTGIASIALLVGGIGIMNMMLVSVTERTKEIGLRKAMGATPERIQVQFLLESIVLSLIGGLIGVALGLLISFAAASLLGTDFVISSSAVGLGVGFSAAVGIVFGWAPARKASRLNPIDALRSE